MLHPLQSQLVEGTAWLAPFVHDFRTRFLSLLAGAFRSFAPALALSILDPQLTFSEAQTQSGVSAAQVIRKADGSALSAYDLKRLQVRPLSSCVSQTAMTHPSVVTTLVGSARQMRCMYMVFCWYIITLLLWLW